MASTLPADSPEKGPEPTVIAPTIAQETPEPTTAPTQAQQPQKATADDDDDSDFDELDGTHTLTSLTPPPHNPSNGTTSPYTHTNYTDVLDDFNKPKPAPPANPPAPSSNPDPSTGITPADFDEDAFLKQLEQDMAKMMAPDGAGSSSDPNFQATVDQGADVFAKQLEESGIAPGDFLKQLLADVMAEENGAGPGASAEKVAAAAGVSANSASASASANAGASADPEQPADSFNDAIKRTMGRMKESGDKATAAASNEDDISDDMLAQLLKAVEAGAAGAGEDGDLSKMFMGMMEQLSNKEMLYEPMKELDGKFGPWIEKNKASGKVSIEDMERFETQARVVRQIVVKFEEKGFSDDDPKCREYIWERMQEMQSAGSPPEELVSNPLMEDLGGAAAGAAGVPDCPQQ
ncbi:Pex19 protein [Penicillium paradoxum]|uniref:Pex19 protein n=1 Tax=Penicillium paradoxum TaxID=176176 RepID=UPI0025486583|nr:Pex19 protein [Penicillium paradoxum]KAJ5773980.1 Pex19 protein [Penicillium paradoxum]